MLVFKLKTTLLGGDYHPHFTDEEVKSQRLTNLTWGHTSSNWQSQNVKCLPLVFKIFYNFLAFFNLTSQYFLCDKDNVHTVFGL